jgi:hypothetical protein
MASQEEYEHFSNEFKSYWYSPRKINIHQENYDKSINKTVMKNMKNLEDCIKNKTKDIITNKPYDVEFMCDGFYGLPPVESLNQGFGNITPFATNKYTELKYLGKALINIGLEPTENSKLDKNKFYIGYDDNENSCDYNTSGLLGFNYIKIRISNTDQKPIYNCKI